MKIYISGKISGLPEKEYINNFDNARREVWGSIQECYYKDIVNPIEIIPFLFIRKWLFYMIADIWKLRKCTHIAMQKNWVDSKGAVIEYFFAKFIFKLKIIWL